MALVDAHISMQQCKRAVDALLTHASIFEKRKAESELLPDKEQNVWLVVNTKIMYPEKKIKPARIPVKYPIVDPRTTPVCLITKDPQREYKDLIANLGIKFISRVVDIRHLKGKWKPFEARRMLLKENGLFLADERVVPLLPALLGKIFFKAKKQPIPVCITRKDLKAELERAISSTYFHQNKGTCTSVKVGTISQTPTQVLANLEMALPEVVKHVKGGWDNVQSCFIKTNSSTALPIWQCELGAEVGARWDGLVADLNKDEDVDVDSEQTGSDADDDDGAEDIEKPAAETKIKGRKRMADEAEEPKKKKKDKGSDPARKRKRKNTPSSEGAVEPTPAPAALRVEHHHAPTPEPPAKKEKRKKARTSLAVSSDAAASASTEAVRTSATAPAEITAPTTPAIYKKPRASTVDFFDDAAPVTTPVSAVSANPPNTPADVLSAETPVKRMKRTKANAPVTTAKLATQPSLAEDRDVSANLSGNKRRRKRQSGDAGQASVVPGSETVEQTAVVQTIDAPAEKKRKRKHKEKDGAVGIEDRPAPMLSAQEIKQKRSAAGVEKKKEKVVGGKPAARSVKVKVVGKQSKRL